MNWIKLFLTLVVLSLFACKGTKKVFSSSKTKSGDQAYTNYVENEGKKWEGKNISSYQFKLNDGIQKSIRDYQGEVILLNFWFSNCPPCITEMASLERLQKEYASKKFKVISLSIDSDSKVKEFIKNYDKTIGYIIGVEAKALAQSLNVHTYPTSYLIDRKGTIRKVFIGASDWDATYTYFTTKKDIEKLLTE